MKYKLSLLSTGFALFSMFFGSGNLVFPLIVGQMSSGHFLTAFLGFFVTAVLVPFLGVFAMILYDGKSEDFFKSMGRPATFWFPLIALSLMGPFGVLARCFTVAHGSFQLLFPEVSLITFSLCTCVLIFVVNWNKGRVVPLLGGVLSPFLMLSLAAIIVFGWMSRAPQEISLAPVFSAFKNGFLLGYQTMDLLAAFFFSTIVISHLRNKFSSTEDVGKILPFLQSSLIGATLLSIVYLGLVFLGFTYGKDLSVVSIVPQQMLGVIAQKAMGPFAAPIVCIAIVLACFTTAVVLASLFATFFKERVSQNKIPDSIAMLVTLTIAFCVSTQDFAGIARFLGPILEAIYPALIVMTLLNIATKVWGTKNRRWPIVLTLIAKLSYF